MAPEWAISQGDARESKFNYALGVMYVVPLNASIPLGDRLVMNQVIDQRVNEIYRAVQVGRLGIGLRGLGQIHGPGRAFSRQGSQALLFTQHSHYPLPSLLPRLTPGGAEQIPLYEGCMFQGLARGYLGPF